MGLEGRMVARFPRLALRGAQKCVLPQKAVHHRAPLEYPPSMFHGALGILIVSGLMRAPVLRLRQFFEDVPIAESVGSPARYSRRRKRAVRPRQVTDHRRAGVAGDNRSLQITRERYSRKVCTG